MRGDKDVQRHIRIMNAIDRIEGWLLLGAFVVFCGWAVLKLIG